MRHDGGHDDLPDLERHACSAQPGQEHLGGRFCELFDALCRRVEQHGAVLGHDQVEEVDLGTDRQQIIEASAGNQYHPSPGLAHPPQRLHGRRRDRAAGRQRTVVVTDQRVKPCPSALNGCGRRCAAAV
jgi:hypothetical protein